MAEHGCLEKVLGAVERDMPDGTFLVQEGREAAEVHLIPVGAQNAPEVVVVTGT